MGNKNSIQQKIQDIGSFLSEMIMPNILAFIAWGILAALFIPTGWLPNERFNELVPPTLNYLLPLLVAYTGGNRVYGTRGGAIASIVTMGLILGAEVTMFLGAMIIGPLSAWLIKKVDLLYEGRVQPGFEMLVRNFSGGILGAVLMIISYLTVGPFFEGLNNIMISSVNWLVNAKLLPLVSVFMEPAKVLFLNNAINFGVFAPIGFEQVADHGSSMMFAIDNPGVGLGILLSYVVFGQGTAKRTAPGAIIIHFFGGIAEIFFPYVLMNPILIIPAILGGMSGVLTLMLTNAGMIAPASPGSIFAFLAVTPRGGHFGILASIFVATTVTFFTSSIVHKLTTSKIKPESFGETQKPCEQIIENKGIKQIIFACDAGMGSSAMGASVVRKRINEADLDIPVTNTAIRELIADSETLVITQESLLNRAKEAAPHAVFETVNNFLDNQQYDDILEKYF